MDLLTRLDFITLYIGHLEDVGWLSYTHLPNVNTFHYTIPKIHVFFNITIPTFQKSLWNYKEHQPNPNWGTVYLLSVVLKTVQSHQKKGEGGGRQKNCHSPEETTETQCLNTIWCPEWEIVQQDNNISGKTNEIYIKTEVLLTTVMDRCWFLSFDESITCWRCSHQGKPRKKEIRTLCTVFVAFL